jgi:serine/threonine protein kinase
MSRCSRRTCGAGGRGPRAPQVSVGDTIAGYVLKDAIGEGGMGRVFLAHDPRLDRLVALKLLPPGDADEEARARFLREARALARVEHPNVVAVHASGVDRDVAWMALEYIEGDPLDEILAGGPLDEETALLLAAQAARGLAAVHGVGVVHRDVKPGNLLLEDDGTLRVVDFGVAYFTEQNAGGGFVTQAGVAVGTPHFMAPEQARGGSVDGRADAWGLGATLFMMIAGHPPFMTDEDEADLDILAKVLRDAAPDLRKCAPGVSAETSSVVRRLLANKREDRLSDLEEIAGLLEACADHLAGRGPMPVIEAAPPADADVASDAPLAPTAPSPSALPRLGLLLGTALLVLVAAGVGWLGGDQPEERGGRPDAAARASAADTHAQRGHRRCACRCGGARALRPGAAAHAGGARAARGRGPEGPGSRGG